MSESTPREIAAQKIKDMADAGEHLYQALQKIQNSLPHQMAECTELAERAKEKWRNSGYGAATTALLAVGNIRDDDLEDEA